MIGNVVLISAVRRRIGLTLEEVARTRSWSGSSASMTHQMRPEVIVVVGTRIRALRSAAQLSVAGLAERSEVSRRMLTQMELGQANPSLATVDKVASALGTTFAALVGVGAASSPEGIQVWSTASGSWAYLLQAIESGGFSVELWRWHLVKGDIYRATGEGTDSMVHVLGGCLLVSSATSDRRISEAQSAQLPRSVNFTFQAEEAPTDFVRVATVRTKATDLE
jgi:transcriptional regulator with XRE-family HTH domain